MRFPTKTLLLTLLYSPLALLVWQNQGAFLGQPDTPVEPLRFLTGRIAAPPGLVLLAYIALLSLVFAALTLSMRAQALLEMRRGDKAVEAARRLADSAELSRIAELRDAMAGEFAGLRSELQAVHNSLAATVAEMDDRLSGAAPVAGPASSASDTPG